MPEGEVEGAVAAPPAHERGRALRQAEGLGRHTAATVAPDDLVLHAEALAQLHGLGEVARGDAHLGPPRPQRVDDRPHDEHVGAVGQVNPDPHRDAHAGKPTAAGMRQAARVAGQAASRMPSSAGLATSAPASRRWPAHAACRGT